MNSETHFKMYKAKKRWLVAGMAAAVFYLGGPAVTQAKAATVDSDQVAASSATTTEDAAVGGVSMAVTAPEASTNNSSTTSSATALNSGSEAVAQPITTVTEPASSSASQVSEAASTNSSTNHSMAVQPQALVTTTQATAVPVAVSSDASIGEAAALSDITSEFSNQEPAGGQGVGANVLATLTNNYQGTSFTNLTAPQQSAYTETLSVYTAGIKAAENDLMISTAAGFAGNYASVTPAEQSAGLSVESLTSRFEQVDNNLNQAFAYGYNFAAFGDRYLSATFGNVDAIPAKDLGYYGIALELRQFLTNITANVSYQNGPNLNTSLQNPAAYPMPNGLADRTQLLNEVLNQLTPIYVAGGENGVRVTAENATPVDFADYAAANPTQASVKLLGLDYGSGIYTAAQTSFENDRLNVYPIIEENAEADVHAGLTEFSDTSWSNVLSIWAANATSNPLSVTILRTIGTEMVTVGRQVFSDLISTAQTAYRDSTSFDILTGKTSMPNPYNDQNELNTMYQDILTVMLARIKKVAVSTDPSGLTTIQQQAISSVEKLSALQALGDDQLGIGTTYDPNWFPYYKANINSGLATEFAGDLATLAKVGQNAYLDALGTRPTTIPTQTGTQPATTIGAWDDGILFAEQQLNPLALDANGALAIDPTTYASFADVLAGYKGTDYDYTSVVKAAYNFQRSKLGQLNLNYVRKLDGQSMIIDGKGSVDLWGFVPATLSVNSDGQSVKFTNGTTQTKTALDLPPVDGVVYTAIPSDADNSAAQLTGDRTTTGYYENIKTVNATLWLKAANTLAEVTVLGTLTKGQLTLTVSQITSNLTSAMNGTVKTTGNQVFDWASATLPAGWTFANGNLTYSGGILNPQGTTLNLTDKVGDTLTVTIGFTNTQTAIFNFVDATDNNQSINSLTNVPTDADRTVSGTFNQPIVPTFTNGTTLQDIVKQLATAHYQLVTDLSGLSLIYDEDDQTTQAFTIAFVHDQTVVTPDNPGQPGQPIDPVNPNGPKWPDGTDLASLQTLGQRTITYVDANTLNPINVAKANNGEVVQQVTFDRYAVIDEVTGAILGYDTNGDGKADVEPNNGNQAWLPKIGMYAAVTSPDLSEYGLINPHDITSPTPTGLPNVPSATAMPNDKLSVTIAYDHQLVPVTPGQHLIPGDPINPDNPNQPVWPAGVADTDLSKTVTRTVHYVDANDPSKSVAPDAISSVSYNRTAVVDAVTGQLLGYAPDPTTGKPTQTASDGGWELASASDALGTVQSPDLTSQGYLAPDQAIVANQVITPGYSGPDQLVVTVTYAHKTVPVTPANPGQPGQPLDPKNPDGPKWPVGTAANDLSQISTRTINYLDRQTGAVVAKQVQQQVSYSRTAIVDQVTGALLGYDTFGKGQVTTTDASQAWVLTSPTDTFAVEISSDLTAAGFLPASLSQVDALKVTPADGAKSQVVNVYYDHATTPVTPEQPQQPGQPIDPANPDGPKWPAGTDVNALTKTVTRTINYLDQQTNAVVASAINQAVTLTRTAIVDRATGVLLGYDLDGNGTVDITDGTAAWQSSGTDVLAAETSPDLTSHGYQLATLKQVAAQTIAGDYDGNSNLVVNVYYAHQLQPVTPQQPRIPGQPIDPNDPNGPKWPTGTDADSLSRTITRTINYLDQRTNAVVSPQVNQAVTLTRTAIVDQVTGNIVGYDTIGDGNANVTDAAQAWVIKGADQLAAVTSPDLSDLGYQLADPTAVAVQTIATTYTGTSQITVNVYYDHQTTTATPTHPGVPGQSINPNDPNGPKWPTGTAASDLTETVTRTINYLDQETGQVVAKPVVQHVTYGRTAIIDQVTGQLLGYDTTGDGKVDTTDGQQAWVSVGTPVLAAVISPDLSAQGYQSASTKQVTAQTISANYKGEMNLAVNVYYDHATTSVTPSWPEQPGQPIDPAQPNGPKWPQGTAADDLTQTVTRTINYLDRQTGSPLATPVEQTVSYRRTAIVDRVTGQLLGYDINGDGQVDTDNGITAWQADGSTELVTVVSPNLQGLGYSAASQYMVDELPIPADYGGARQLTVNVYYDHQVMPATPVHPGNPGEPINPADPNGPKWPAETGLDQLTKTITRTITYLNETTGTTVANPVVQTITYHRTALVDAVTGQLLGYDIDGDGRVDTTDALNAWVVDGTDTLETVTSPQLAGFGEPSLPVIGEQVIPGSYTGDRAMHVIVYYRPLTQPVNPVGPTQPDQPSEPSTPVEPTQPDQPSEPTTPIEPTQPDQPSKPTTPVGPSVSVEPNVPVDAVPVQTRMQRFNHQPRPTAPQRASLPKTDAQRHGLLATIWLAVLSLFGLGSLRRKKNVK